MGDLTGCNSLCPSSSCYTGNLRQSMKGYPQVRAMSLEEEKRAWWPDVNSRSIKRTLICATWSSHLSQRAITPEDGFDSRGSISARMMCFDVPNPCSRESTVFTYLPVFKMFVKSNGELQLIKVEPIQEMTHTVPLSHHMTLSNIPASCTLQKP